MIHRLKVAIHVVCVITVNSYRDQELNLETLPQQ